MVRTFAVQLATPFALSSYAVWPISLRPSYCLLTPYLVLAYGAWALVLDYGAMRCMVLASGMVLGSFGTDIGYGATGGMTPGLMNDYQDEP
eukprot:3271945-Rhodomonas_salina.3